MRGPGTCLAAREWLLRFGEGQGRCDPEHCATWKMGGEECLPLPCRPGTPTPQPDIQPLPSVQACVITGAILDRTALHPLLVAPAGVSNAGPEVQPAGGKPDCQGSSTLGGGHGDDARSKAWGTRTFCWGLAQGPSRLLPGSLRPQMRTVRIHVSGSRGSAFVHGHVHPGTCMHTESGS